MEERRGGEHLCKAKVGRGGPRVPIKYLSQLPFNRLPGSDLSHSECIKRLLSLSLRLGLFSLFWMFNSLFMPESKLSHPLAGHHHAYYKSILYVYKCQDIIKYEGSY